MYRLCRDVFGFRPSQINKLHCMTFSVIIQISHNFCMRTKKLKIEVETVYYSGIW